MSKARSEAIQQVIEQLNAIGVGDIGALLTRLGMIERDLDRLGIDALKETVGAARSNLERGQLTDFRRLIAQASSKLGHLR